MIKTDVIAEIIGQLGQIDICQNGFKNSFCFGPENVFYFYDNFICETKFKIIGTLEEKELNLNLGEAYFFMNDGPFCCKISQINHPNKNYRNNYEVLIILGVDILSSELSSLFKRYYGEIFDLEAPINNRFEILDL